MAYWAILFLLKIALVIFRSPRGYRRLWTRFGRFKIVVYLLAGNGRSNSRRWGQRWLDVVVLFTVRFLVHLSLRKTLPRTSDHPLVVRSSASQKQAVMVLVYDYLVAIAWKLGKIINLPVLPLVN